MVLAGGPDLLLLDEPTAGMAPEETGNTAAVLRDLSRTEPDDPRRRARHGVRAQEIARRVTVPLHQGRVFADGTIDEVTARQDVRDIYLGRRVRWPRCSPPAICAPGYGAGDVLQGVSVEVGQGEIVAVLGRNGVEQEHADEGADRPARAARGQDRSEAAKTLPGRSADRRAKRGVGYVPQGREIFPHMTVADNLRMGRFTSARARRTTIRRSSMRFAAISPLFGSARRVQRGGTLSGGQQEMLSIAARAQRWRSAAFLLDEPSDGVQPSIVQGEIGEFLQILVRRGDRSECSSSNRTSKIDPGGGRAGLMSWTRVELSPRWTRRRSQTLRR